MVLILLFQQNKCKIHKKKERRCLFSVENEMREEMAECVFECIHISILMDIFGFFCDSNRLEIFVLFYIEASKIEMLTMRIAE